MESRNSLVLASGPMPTIAVAKEANSEAEPELDFEVVYEKLCFVV